MRVFSYAVLLIIMILGLVFAILNSGQVVFNYYLGTTQISLSLLLVFTLGFGIFLGFIFTVISVIRLKKDKYRLKSKIKDIEKELENLRTLPIKGE
jgi:lipopolysaccharide assembly protein A